MEMCLLSEIRALTMARTLTANQNAMTNRINQLKQLMDEHGLTIEAVAVLLNRSPQTVRIWRCRNVGRQIPEHALELLRARLEALD